MVSMIVDGLEVEMDLELGIAEKVKMGRRRSKTGHLQQQHQHEAFEHKVKRGRSSIGNMVKDNGGSVTTRESPPIVKDGVDDVNSQGSVEGSPLRESVNSQGSVEGSPLRESFPPQGSVEGSPLEESDSSEDIIPSSQPLVEPRRKRRSSRQARETMRQSIGQTKSKQKEMKPKEEVSRVMMTTCPDTGDQCVALFTPNLVHFHRRASSQHLWTSKGSIQSPTSMTSNFPSPNLGTPFSKSMSLLATKDSLVLQTFSADEQSVKESKTGVDSKSSCMVLLTEQEEEKVVEVLSCSITSTSAALFWNLVGGKASGAVYDWGLVNGVEKQTLTHLVSSQNVKVTGIVKIDGKRMVAASTSDAFVSVWSFDTGQRLSRLSLNNPGFNLQQTPAHQLVKMAIEGEQTFGFVISATCLEVLVVRDEYPAVQALSLKIPPPLAEIVSTAGAKLIVQGPTISLLVGGVKVQWLIQQIGDPIVRWQILQSPAMSTVTNSPSRSLDNFFV